MIAGCVLVFVPVTAQFLVPDEVRASMGAAAEAGEARYRDWEARYYAFRDGFHTYWTRVQIYDAD